jgi:hypothetical protein
MTAREVPLRENRYPDPARQAEQNEDQQHLDEFFAGLGDDGKAALDYYEESNSDISADEVARRNGMKDEWQLRRICHKVRIEGRKWLPEISKHITNALRALRRGLNGGGGGVVANQEATSLSELEALEAVWGEDPDFRNAVVIALNQANGHLSRGKRDEIARVIEKAIEQGRAVQAEIQSIDELFSAASAAHKDNGKGLGALTQIQELFRQHRGHRIIRQLLARSLPPLTRVPPASRSSTTRLRRIQERLLARIAECNRR